MAWSGVWGVVWLRYRKKGSSPLALRSMKLCRLVGEHVGQVAIDLLLLEPAQHLVAAHRRPVFAADRAVLHARQTGVDEDAAAFEHAEVLVEAPAHRMMGLLVPQMPLADHAGPVAQRLHPVGQGRLIQAHAGAHVPAGRIELPTVTLLVAAGHQPGPRRTAHRMADVARREANAARRQRVDVRGRDHLAAVDADVGVAEVVGQDQHDVRRRAGAGLHDRRVGVGCGAGKEHQGAHRQRPCRH